MNAAIARVRPHHPGRRPVCLVLLLLLLLSARVAGALEPPLLKGRVNDYAGILSPATVTQMEASLADFEAAESSQIVVLTIPSLEGDSLEAFSLRVAETWKPGQKELDNGALLLIASRDRKLRIEVGYGLEGTLTDLASGRIIRNIITPRFKEGNFDQGVIDGINAMMATIKGEFTPPPDRKKNRGRGIDPGAVFIFALIAFSVMGRILTRSPLISGGIGAILAPLIAAFILPVTLVGIVILAILGFIFGLIAASSGGYWGGFSAGGGDSGGGSFDGGGFSGGGGDFGGGGSSGSW